MAIEAVLPGAQTLRRSAGRSRRQATLEVKYLARVLDPQLPWKSRDQSDTSFAGNSQDTWDV